MNILVAGAGGIGQWLGALLQQAGHQVTLLTRPRFLEPLRQGLRITGETDFNAPITCVDDADQLPTECFDAIIVTCKAYDTRSVAQAVASKLKATGIAITLQNGIGNTEELLTVFPPAQVVTALTSNGVTVHSPGNILHAGKGPTVVAPANPTADDAAQVAFQLFEDAGLRPTYASNAAAAVWAKAIVNAGINPVGALSGATNGEILQNGALRKKAIALVHEALATAHANGIDLAQMDFEQAMLTTLERTRPNQCSMLQDLRSGKSTEIESITGRIVQQARTHGVPVPESEKALAAVKMCERERDAES